MEPCSPTSLASSTSFLDEGVERKVGGSSGGGGMRVGAFRQSCCPICLERYTPSNPAVLFNCEHSFHYQCIDDWWQRSNKCPVCDRGMKRRHGREAGTAPARKEQDGSTSSEEDIFPVSRVGGVLGGGRPPNPPAEVDVQQEDEEEVMTDEEVMQFFSAEELDRLSRHPILVRHNGLAQVDLLRGLLARRRGLEQRRQGAHWRRSLREASDVDGEANSHPPSPKLPGSTTAVLRDTHHRNVEMSAPPRRTSNEEHERVRLTEATSDAEDEEEGDGAIPHRRNLHLFSCCCCSALRHVGAGLSYLMRQIIVQDVDPSDPQPSPTTLRSALGFQSPIGVNMPPSPNSSATASPLTPSPPTKTKMLA